MPKNKKQSSQQLSSDASTTLKDPNASKIQKSLAGSVLSQTKSNNRTSDAMATKAAKALNNNNSAEKTKELAASVLSQS